ncbi:hypothetical protein ACHAQA_006728 [Verticillium albo-atrum]
MDSPKYSVVSSCHLMENHIAAAVLDNASGFSAHLTPAGATVLLSIGSDSIFRASVEESGTKTGWTVTDISPLLAQQYPAGTSLVAHSFAASGAAAATGGFFILLAVTLKQGDDTFDEVWLLTGPPGADASSWLVGGASIIWKKLVYDAEPSVPTQAIKASTLQVTGLHLESGLEETDGTLALGTVVDPAAPGQLRCFVLDLTVGTGPVWTYYQQEQNIGTTDLRLVPGRISSDSSWGLYKLYQLGTATSLTYLPTKGSFGKPNATLFTVPSGASALASLVYQPSATDKTAYTDLFVAANGFLGYFPYNQGRPHEAVQVVTSPLITGVTQLHAVNCNGKAVVWGLNAAGQLFYTTAPLAQRADPSAWQAPIALLSGTTAIAALAGTAADAISLFAVSPLSSTTATGTKGGSGLIQLGRNPATGAWLSSVHPFPSTVDCITLKTYTTRALLVDSNNVPQPGAKITASASADCSLVINGSVTSVTTTETLALKTDGGGYVSLIHAVSSLATASFTLELPDGSTSTIDPSGNVVAALTGIDKSDLASATYVDAHGETRNLVAPGTSDEAVKGVAQSLQTISAKLPTLPRAAAVKAGLQVPGIAAAANAAAQDGGFFSDLGDIVQWIGSVVEDVGRIIFDVIDGVITFVADIAGKLFRAIVNTVEDALHAITALFKWIGVDVEAIFRWLGFLFDWSDFVAVKDVLKDTVKQGLRSFASIQDQFQASGDAWFAHARANVLPRLSSTPMARPGSNQSMQDAWSGAQPTPPPVGPSKTDLRTDPRLGWLKDRVNTPASSESGGSLTTDEADPMAPLIAAINTLVSDVGTAFKTVFSNIGKLVSGDMSAADFFSSVLATLELLGLDALQAVFDALMAVAKIISSAVETALEMPIQIPILSGLYRSVTGSDLTVLDATCLVFSIGITLVYKIATGESPLASLKQAVTPAAVDKAVGGLPNVLRPPAVGKVTSAPAAKMEAVDLEAAGVGADAVIADSSSALQKLSGALLIVQGITQSIWGAGDMGQLTALSNVGFIFDLMGRTLRRLIETADNGFQTQVSGTQIGFEFAWSMFLFQGAAWNLYKGGLGSPAVHTMALVDINVSLVWGIWHFVNIYDFTQGGGSCPVGFTGEAVIEVLEPIQLGAALSAQPEVAVVLLVIRDISAIVAGIARF